MPTKHRIVIVRLEEVSQAAVDQCLPSDHFEITDFSHIPSSPLSIQPDLIIFRAGKLDQTETLCESLRSVGGDTTPLLACVAAEAYEVLRPLRGNPVQGIIPTPFNATTLRRKLDELDLGF